MEETITHERDYVANLTYSRVSVSILNLIVGLPVKSYGKLSNKNERFSGQND